ncbi:hypothetical protein PR048_021691 [Dryococelus australis]|uniref:Uncharacterized protein n=1 Tax=Dryococelus australis TaxID=614101 RepID=A0ABQ9GZ04_9NEOP|nr:hypothetical protein PR048_021691 [Dryococelus australis]
MSPKSGTCGHVFCEGIHDDNVRLKGKTRYQNLLSCLDVNVNVDEISRSSVAMEDQAISRAAGLGFCLSRLVAARRLLMFPAWSVSRWSLVVASHWAVGCECWRGAVNITPARQRQGGERDCCVREAGRRLARPRQTINSGAEPGPIGNGASQWRLQEKFQRRPPTAESDLPELSATEEQRDSSDISDALNEQRYKCPLMEFLSPIALEGMWGVVAPAHVSFNSPPSHTSSDVTGPLRGGAREARLSNPVCRERSLTPTPRYWLGVNSPLRRLADLYARARALMHVWTTHLSSLDTASRSATSCLTSQLGGAMVAERLARSPPTKANRAQSPAGSPDFRKWESCRTMPLVGGFSRGSPPPRHSSAAPYSLQSPTSALKTSLLRAAQSSLTHFSRASENMFEAILLAPPVEIKKIDLSTCARSGVGRDGPCKQLLAHRRGEHTGT